MIDTHKNPVRNVGFLLREFDRSVQKFRPVWTQWPRTAERDAGRWEV